MDKEIRGINIPLILPAKKVHLPNEEPEKDCFPEEVGYTMHNGTIYFNFGD